MLISGVHRTINRKRAQIPPIAVMFSVAAAIATLMSVAKIGAHRSILPKTSMCWMTGDKGALAPLRAEENLESCGALLEAVYIREHQPVSGGFGGVGVLVNDSGIYTAAPGGPRVPLIDANARRRIDDDIVRLMVADGERPSGPTIDLRPPAP